MQRHLMNIVRVSILIVLSAAVMFAGGTTITIVHVNDTHSHIDAFGPKDFHLNGTIGGIAKAAYIFGTIRANEPNVVLLHVGDAYVGDFFFNAYFGVPELQIMSSLGFDAMAVGNHEFDLTPDALLGSLVTAKPTFPLLSANLDMSNYPNAAALSQFVQPYTIIERAGVKIGIFGLTVWDNPTTNSSPIVIYDPTIMKAADMVNTLQGLGAKVIICLSHMGFLHDQQVAAAVAGINVIVGAHDHYVFDQPVKVNQTLILQAGSFYLNVGELRLSVDPPNVTLVDYEMIPVDRNVPAVPQVKAIVESLKPGIVKEFGDVYHKIVGFAPWDLELLYNPQSQMRDTPMGDLVTDALRQRGGTQLGFSAIGLINEKIYAGAIVGADVFRSFPYGFDPKTALGFKLVKVTVDGASLAAALQTALYASVLDQDFFPQVSGMTFRYDGSKDPASNLILSSIRINGKPFDPSAQYTMTVDEGLAGLLPLLNVTPLKVKPIPDFEYDVVKDYIHRLGLVAYRPEGRIRDVSVKCLHEHFADDGVALASQPDPAAAPKTFDLSQNYPNPFNPSTMISYALPLRTKANLTVFNALGQVVKELVNEEEEAGVHQVRFDGTGLASGVYFYRLQAGSFVETKRLTLVK
jgi:5'-nucleotidase/UDP-sugar diphosphatase